MSSPTFWNTLFGPHCHSSTENHNDKDADSNSNRDAGSDIHPSQPSPSSSPPSSPPHLTSLSLVDSLWAGKLSLQAKQLLQTQSEQQQLLQCVSEQVSQLIKVVAKHDEVVERNAEIVKEAGKLVEERAMEEKEKEGEVNDAISSLTTTFSAVQQQVTTLSTYAANLRVERETMEQQRVEELDMLEKRLMEGIRALLATAPGSCPNCAVNDKKSKGRSERREGMKNPAGESNTPLEEQVPATRISTSPLQPVSTTTNEPKPVPQVDTRKSPPKKRTLLDESQEEFDDDPQMLLIKGTPYRSAAKQQSEVEASTRTQKRRLVQLQYDDGPDF